MTMITLTAALMTPSISKNEDRNDDGYYLFRRFLNFYPCSLFIDSNASVYSLRGCVERPSPCLSHPRANAGATASTASFL
jgi:hypothetical protein